MVRWLVGAQLGEKHKQQTHLMYLLAEHSISVVSLLEEYNLNVKNTEIKIIYS